MTSIDEQELGRLYRQHVAHLSAATATALVDTGYDGVVIHSGVPLRKSAFDDQLWPLRPTPHFQHWLPLATPDCALIVVPGRVPLLAHNVERSFWEGPTAAESTHFWASFDVRPVAGFRDARPLIPTGRIAFVGDEVAGAAALGLTEANPKTLVTRLDALRSRKTPYEILCLAEANRRAAAGHERVAAAFLADDPSELELHLLFLAATKQDEPETPYKNIVALGRHGATLHHVAYGKHREGAGSLLLDAGATFLGYASDVTRTTAKGSGAAALTFAELVRRMDLLSRDMCGRVVVGTPYESLHDVAHQLLADILVDLGIVRGSKDELVDLGVTRKFFPHGLGHSLGLQCHDVGCATRPPRPENPFLRNTSDVEVSQVFTIEPGCYFIDGLLGELRGSALAGRVDWSLVEGLAAFGGVRIEDNLAVLATGVRNLTREHLRASRVTP